MKTLITSLFVAAALLVAACGDDDDDSATTDQGGAVGDAGAQETTFNVTMDVAGERVPCAAAAAGATGSATITISADESTVTVSNLTWSGLSGDATAAHIHVETAPAAAGPVAVPFMDLVPPVDTVVVANDSYAPPNTDAPQEFPAFVAALKAGQAYLNVHTMACMPGEIAGTIE